MILPENSDAVCWRRVEGIFRFQKRIATGFQKGSLEHKWSPEFAKVSLDSFRKPNGAKVLFGVPRRDWIP